MFVHTTGAAVLVPEPVHQECKREHAAEESGCGQTLCVRQKPLEKGQWCTRNNCVHTVIHPLLLPIAPPTQISSVVDENGSFDVTPLK